MSFDYCDSLKSVDENSDGFEINLSAKNSQTQSQIEETSSVIQTISAENANAHANVIRKQHELYSITAAMTKNIDIYQSMIEDLNKKNELLTTEYLQKKELADQIQDLLDTCTSTGIDIHQIPNLNISALQNYFNIKTPSNTDLIVDPTVKKIISSNRYFANCRSNDEFVRRVIELFDSTQKQSNSRIIRVQGLDKDSRLISLKRQLANLQQENAMLQAQRAFELNTLLREKQELQKELEMLKARKVSACVTPDAHVDKKKNISSPIVGTESPSPIQNRRFVPSPFKV